MQKLKVEYTNELNVNVFDKDFYIMLLQDIKSLREKVILTF